MTHWRSVGIHKGIIPLCGAWGETPYLYKKNYKKSQKSAKKTAFKINALHCLKIGQMQAFVLSLVANI